MPWFTRPAANSKTAESVWVPTDEQEEDALLRLFREIKTVIVFDDNNYGRLNIKASLLAWCRYRRTDPTYIKEYWREYNALAYKYIYPVLWWVMQMAGARAVWELGGWSESDVDPGEVERKRKQAEERADLQRSALAKLTPEERRALGLLSN